MLLWRGFTVEDCADQLLGNSGDTGKGRQLPVHYGSRKLHFQTISSPLGTTIPQVTSANQSSNELIKQSINRSILRLESNACCHQNVNVTVNASIYILLVVFLLKIVFGMHHFACIISLRLLGRHTR